MTTPTGLGKWVLLALASMGLDPVSAHGQYTYETNNSKLTIASYSGPGGAVTLPADVNGEPVVAVGDFAFVACGSLTNVIIPASFTQIG